MIKKKMQIFLKKQKFKKINEDYHSIRYKKLKEFYSILYSSSMMLTLESPSSSYSAHSLSLKSNPSNIVSLLPTPLALKSTPVEIEEKHKRKKEERKGRKKREKKERREKSKKEERKERKEERKEKKKVE